LTYVRISIMKPLANRELEALKLNKQLVEHYRSQTGCFSSHVIQAADGSGEIGRVSFWESESTADAAATADHSMSLRASLHLIVRKGHQDRSFHSD
jgi:quinol monooxygenase YgiN